MQRISDSLTKVLPSKQSFEVHAEVAQLVERNLAKVEVAGSSLVFRSIPSREVEFFVCGSNQFSVFCLQFTVVVKLQFEI